TPSVFDKNLPATSTKPALSLLTTSGQPSNSSPVCRHRGGEAYRPDFPLPGFSGLRGHTQPRVTRLHLGAQSNQNLSNHAVAFGSSGSGKGMPCISFSRLLR